MMPPQDSAAEQRMTGAFNVKTRLSASLGGGEAELVAEGVWVVQGQPGRCNVYLIEDDGGVTLFDAGARTMTRAVASAGAKLGGIRRVVLGHGHTDHRGVAPALGVPVLCHPDEVQDAEGSGGFRYWPQDLAGLPPGMRQVHRAAAPLRLGRRARWRSPARVTEGDEVAGFRVVDLPGHAPGLIGLWRESDRLALCSDCFYTLDMWGRDCAPRAAGGDLQLRHRAGAREHPQARRARAGRRVAGPRQAGHRRRARRSSSGPPTPAERGQARRAATTRLTAPEQRLHRRARQRADACAAR